MNITDCCSKCKEKADLLWRVDCYHCDGKTCPKCSKIKLGIFKAFKKVENCVCDLATDNKEKKCSLCERVLPESGLKLFCSDCLGIDFKETLEVPKPVEVPPGKRGGGSFISGASWIILFAFLVAIVIGIVLIGISFCLKKLLKYIYIWK